VNRGGTTADLVRRAQRGDTQAFEPLVRAFLRACYSVALGVLGRPADAEDVAQDAFVVALERIHTCRHPERFAGWLLQIVRNRALNRLEARRRRDVGAERDPPQVASATLATPAGMERRLVQALDELSGTQREVVLLHDLEEWTHAEIADALGISEGMSRQHLFQARRVLRARLGERARAEAADE